MKIEPLITKKAAADILDVCPKTIDKYVAQGRLKVVRIGRTTRFDPGDLRDFINQSKVCG